MLAVEVRISIHCDDFHSLYSSLLFDDTVSAMMIASVEGQTVTLRFPLQYRLHIRKESLLRCGTSYFIYQILQDAQLSQRDRAAGCVTVFAKSRRLELGDNILRTL